MAEIFPLSEGLYTVGHDKKLVPFIQGTDELNDRPIGSLLVEVQPFLVVTLKDIIVFDTGLGYNNDQGELRIHGNIRGCGYEPEQVTKVLLSHLHKDHAGCLTYYDQQGVLRVTFPNATYYIYRNEADYALQTGPLSYSPEDIEPLLMTPQVEWLDGEQGFIDGYIQYSHSGGHCPYHVVYLVDDGTGKLFYGGDEAPQLKQMKMRYIAKYDADGKKAMGLRAIYAEKGKAEGWRFMFYHDFKHPVAVLE